MNKDLTLHIETPLLEFRSQQSAVSGNVWLKMEALQPCASFKARGMGHACQEYVARGAKRLVSSSGGNAGLAVAYAGRKLGVPVVVVVPETTTEQAIALIRQEQAEVKVVGESWKEAHQYAQGLCDDESIYLHPFDDPLIWEGHATLIDEIKQSGIKPDVVVLSVGGGGLLCGVLEGLKKNDWQQIPVVAVETLGAESLHRSVQAGKLIELERITSLATTLGAKQVTPAAFDWTQKHTIYSCTVSDQEAVEACLQFCDDHRIVVEPACGASLALLYKGVDFLEDKKNIVVIVCGGAGVTIDQLQAWRNQG